MAARVVYKDEEGRSASGRPPHLIMQQLRETGPVAAMRDNDWMQQPVRVMNGAVGGWVMVDVYDDRVY
jgi:hypothetical protein